MAKRSLNFTSPKQPAVSPARGTIQSPEQRATVNAMIVSISPTKPGAHYFDGELTGYHKSSWV